MLQRIDHIVVLVRDLSGGIADWKHAGFTVTPGGEHLGGATHNALVSFSDGTYIELVAFLQPDRPQVHRWWPRLALGEGLTDYALGSEDAAADAERLRMQGLHVIDPSDQGRDRPDGRRVRWRSVMLGRGVNQPALPFLIEDLTPRELRVPAGDATFHRCGATGVAGVTAVVGTLSETQAALAKVLGSDGQVDPSTGAETIAFTLGSQWIRLLQPSDPDSPAGRYLRRFGDSAYEITLKAAPTDDYLGVGLLAGNLHGARIQLNRVSEAATEM